MTEAPRIRALVFDWDGTLIDSTGPIVDALRAAVQDLGHTPPPRAVAAGLIGLVLPQMARRLVPSLDEAGVQRFVERYRHHYFQIDESLRPYEGIESLLDTLAAVPVWLAVATGKSRVGLLRALEHLDWHQPPRRRFISLRCGDDGLPKPNPWMLQDLGQELGLAPEEMLMIGDTTHDLGMARAAGVAAVAVSYGGQPQAQLEAFIASAGAADPPVALVHDVQSLRELLLARLTPGAVQ